MLSNQQQEALDRVRDWLTKKEQPVFRLFGYAGTGKTTIAKEMNNLVGGRVLFGAYTGKAALVLQQKGCLGAQTVHRMIYTPTPSDRARIDELQSLLKDAKEQVPVDEKRVAMLEHEIADETSRAKKPRFSLNMKSDLFGASLAVIDEASMIGEKMGEDLMSFDCPILVLGDPAQLPPVQGGGYFTGKKPDFLLTEIHRQAEGNPILQLATLTRQGESLDYGTWGDSRVVPKGHLKIHEVAAHDQVIVGTNRARKDLNTALRAHLGRKSIYPEPGDKVVCLRNDYDLGLLNGGQWLVTGVQEVDQDCIMLTIKDGELEITVSAWKHYFEDREHEISPWEMRENASFDFGLAMTCHKAQGSQFKKVLVIDESYVFRGDAKRWLYTAITRASESVTIVRR